MTFTFQFSIPYTGLSSERLDKAQQQAANNVSASSDLSGFTGSSRTVEGTTVYWTLEGLDPADLSAETRQAVITAIQDHVPGAADFEIVE